MPITPETDNREAPQGEPPPASTREPPTLQWSITKVIPPLDSFKVPTTLDELFGQGSSPIGHSKVSSYLSCPERARLAQLGVRRKAGFIDDLYTGPIELDALGFGTLMHAMMAIRKIYGTDGAIAWMQSFPIASASKDDAFNMIKTWDYEFPLPEKHFTTLGVEVEVFTDIGDGRGGSCVRSVRYDELAWRPNTSTGKPEVLGLEHKTMASSPGSRGTTAYFSQIATQLALWNRNESLVSTYGPMVGVIVDAMIKTKVPKADRLGPVFSNQHVEQLAVDYLRLPEQIQYPSNADGSYPRMLHACYGKYQPCSYIGLCLNGEQNNYEVVDRIQKDPIVVAGD